MSHRYPDLGLAFSIPNGGSRNKIEAVNLKRTGTKAGVPDIFFPIPAGPFHGLFIEMKREDGGKISPEQRFWIEQLRIKGYRTEVCYGFEEAKILISNYFNIPSYD